MIINDIKELCVFDLINKRRALCIDYGDKRVGIALSDIGWRISSPFDVLKSHGVFRELFEIIEEYKVGFIVVGAPKSLKGEDSGKQYEKVKKFTCKLIELINKKDLEINILYWDERLSSVAANRFLSETEMTINSKKKNIDKVAASFILQGVLNHIEFMQQQTKNLENSQDIINEN